MLNMTKNRPEYNIRYTQLLFCGGDCERISAELGGEAPRDPFEEAHKYKYVIDVVCSHAHDRSSTGLCILAFGVPIRTATLSVGAS